MSSNSLSFIELHHHKVNPGSQNWTPFHSKEVGIWLYTLIRWCKALCEPQTEQSLQFFSWWAYACLIYTGNQTLNLQGISANHISRNSTQRWITGFNILICKTMRKQLERGVGVVWVWFGSTAFPCLPLMDQIQNWTWAGKGWVVMSRLVQGDASCWEQSSTSLNPWGAPVPALWLISMWRRKWASSNSDVQILQGLPGSQHGSCSYYSLCSWGIVAQT